MENSNTSKIAQNLADGDLVDLDNSAALYVEAHTIPLDLRPLAKVQDESEPSPPCLYRYLAHLTARVDPERLDNDVQIVSAASEFWVRPQDNEAHAEHLRQVISVVAHRGAALLTHDRERLDGCLRLIANARTMAQGDA